MKLTQYYDVFIAGGGLGGLIASALLTQQGKSVYLSERLPFFGGRFTTHNLDGYEIPTGAVHMIPHSQRGILGQILLKKLSLPLNIVDTHNFTTRILFYDRNELHDNSITFDDYLSSKTDDPQIFNFFNAFTGFALSLDISELTPATMFRFVDRLHKSGKAGVPIGGCKRVSENLVRFSRNMGGTLKNNSQLILLEKNGSELNSGVVCNTRTNEESEVKAKEFILNLGVNQINSVLEKSKFDFRLPVSPGAIGGGFVFSSKRSLLKKSTVAQFPDCKYVKGAVEPTLISPELAPKGRHLFLTHQVFRLKDVVTATKRARDEVLDLFPSLQEEDELCVHTFHRNWPVNNAMQGADNKNISDIFQNLSFVGDGFKGNTGWFMSEGVAYGAQKVVKDILNKKS
jgi:phytoene dehydrogenase-like protein